MYKLIVSYFFRPVYTIPCVTESVTRLLYFFFFLETSFVFILLFPLLLFQDVSDFQSMFSLYRKILCKTDFSFCLAKDFLLFFLFHFYRADCFLLAGNYRNLYFSFLLCFNLSCFADCRNFLIGSLVSNLILTVFWC